MTGTLGKVHFDGIYAKLKDKELSGADKLVRAAFEDPSITEPELAQICDIIFYLKAEALFSHLAAFIQRFPHTVFPAKAQFATFLAQTGRVALATELAREHLRALRDRGALDRAREAPPLFDGALRSFLVLTGTYTLAGARSYSLRVLELGRRICGSEGQAAALEREHAAIGEELKQPGFAQADRAWEAFFSSGAGAEKLIEDCKKLKLDNLARRVELLSDVFAHEPGFKVDENELFLLVMTGKKKDGSDPTPVQFLA